MCNNVGLGGGEGEKDNSPLTVDICHRAQSSKTWFLYTGWGKSRFTVVHMENNTILDK